jgi:hypothetical protein
MAANAFFALRSDHIGENCRFFEDSVLTGFVWSVSVLRL